VYYVNTHSVKIRMQIFALIPVALCALAQPVNEYQDSRFPTELDERLQEH
jgi:hypothetical protein